MRYSDFGAVATDGHCKMLVGRFYRVSVHSPEITAAGIRAGSSLWPTVDAHGARVELSIKG